MTQESLILSIDVGLKTMAMCCVSPVQPDKFEVKLWELYNMLEDDCDKTCQSVTKKGTVCGKKCSYKYNTTLCCKTHVPKGTTGTALKHKKVKDYNLHTVARAVISTLNKVYQENVATFSQVQKIVIELQPKCNNKMKMVSHIIFGKLVDLLYNQSNVAINFVRASQKLTAYSGPVIECKLKGEYARRKWMSVQHAQWFLETRCSQSQEWLDKLKSHTKKDDIADALNMCMVELYKRKNNKRAFGFAV